MYRETRKEFLLLCTAVILLQPALFSQEAKKEGKAQGETTEVRIQVAGGDEPTPVKGATVYIEWKEEGETKSKEGTTNRQGIAGPFRLPWVKVLVQITTDDNEWERYGHEYNLKDEDQPIKITLRKKR